MVHIMFKPKSAKSPVQNTDINTVKVKLSDATHSLVDNRTVYYRPTKEVNTYSYVSLCYYPSVLDCTYHILTTLLVSHDICVVGRTAGGYY